MILQKIWVTLMENEDHGIQSHHFVGNRWGNSGNSGWLYFGLQNHCRWWLQPEIKRCLLLGRKVMTNLELWCWRILLRVPWIARRSNCHPKGNQSWIFIGRTDAEAQFQYFGHLIWITDSLEKTLMVGKIEGRRRRGRQGMRWLDVQTLGVGNGQGSLMLQRVIQDWATELTEAPKKTQKALSELLFIIS